MEGNRTPGKSLAPAQSHYAGPFLHQAHTFQLHVLPSLPACSHRGPTAQPSVLQAFLGPSPLLHSRDSAARQSSRWHSPSPRVGLSLRVLARGGPGDKEERSLTALSFGRGSGLLTIEPSATPLLPCGLLSTPRLREGQRSRYMLTFLLGLRAWSFSSPTDLCPPCPNQRKSDLGRPHPRLRTRAGV